MTQKTKAKKIKSTTLTMHPELHDALDNPDIKPIKASVSCCNGRNIEIKVEGYGDPNSVDGEGSPILIEYADGKLRVVVWPDINVEEPIIIELDGAKESNRKEIKD
jgi:hypothetical protein